MKSRWCWETKKDRDDMIPLFKLNKDCKILNIGYDNNTREFFIEAQFKEHNLNYFMED